MNDVYASVNGGDWLFLGSQFNPDDPLYFTVIPPSDDPEATVTIVWPRKAEDWLDGLTCRMTRSHTAPVVPRLVSYRLSPDSGEIGHLFFDAPNVLNNDDCARYSPIPMTFTVTSRGKTRRLRYQDQCPFGRNRPRNKEADHWYLEDADGPQLSAYAEIGPRRQRFRVTLKQGNRTRRWTRTANRRHTRIPRRRYYEGSDAFYNYCVRKHGDRIRQEGGVKYCDRPAVRADFVFWTR